MGHRNYYYECTPCCSQGVPKEESRGINKSSRPTPDKRFANRLAPKIFPARKKKAQTPMVATRAKNKKTNSSSPSGSSSSNSSSSSGSGKLEFISSEQVPTDMKEFKTFFEKGNHKVVLEDGRVKLVGTAKSTGARV